MGQEFLEDKNWSDDRTAGGLIWWEGLYGADHTMADFLRMFTDIVKLRRSQPALRYGSIRISRMNNFDRVLAFHRWIEGEGQDVMVIASFDELPKRKYSVGLPSAGRWREIFNTDYYDGFPNASVIGNGGIVTAIDARLDGFVASASIQIPANGALVLARE